MDTQRKGMRAEGYVQHWLENKGLVLLEKNFQRKTGELDLIMSEGNTIVFVEVRYRSHSVFGGALASIGKSKQQRLLNTANLYLQAKGLDRLHARIDVVTLEGSLDNPQCQWIKNAIEG